MTDVYAVDTAQSNLLGPHYQLITMLGLSQKDAVTLRQPFVIVQLIYDQLLMPCLFPNRHLDNVYIHPDLASQGALSFAHQLLKLPPLYCGRTSRLSY